MLSTYHLNFYTHTWFVSKLNVHKYNGVQQKKSFNLLRVGCNKYVNYNFDILLVFV